MKISRLLRHLFSLPALGGKAFGASTRAAIEAAIRAAEAGHRGELRFVIEGGLDWPTLRACPTARDRALELFSQLRVWDTECNSGVLIYVNVLDREVELVADRGIHALVGQPGWRAIVEDLEAAYRVGDFEQGSLRAIERIGVLLRQHFPATGANPDELPDTPLLLGR